MVEKLRHQPGAQLRELEFCSRRMKACGTLRRFFLGGRCRTTTAFARNPGSSASGPPGRGPMARPKSMARSGPSARPKSESKARPRSKSKARPRSKSKARPRSKPKARPRSKTKAHPRSKSKAHPHRQYRGPVATDLLAKANSWEAKLRDSGKTMLADRVKRLIIIVRELEAEAAKETEKAEEGGLSVGRVEFVLPAHVQEEVDLLEQHLGGDVGQYETKLASSSHPG